MGFLNANHVMSLFCSKPFIGFLHIQSKTLLKCWQGLALAIALFFFFFFTSHLQHHQRLSQPPSLHPTHRHSGILIVCQIHQEENSHPGTSASAVPTGLRPSSVRSIAQSFTSFSCRSVINISEMSFLTTLYKVKQLPSLPATPAPVLRPDSIFFGFNYYTRT